MAPHIDWKNLENLQGKVTKFLKNTGKVIEFHPTYWKGTGNFSQFLIFCSVFFN